MILSSNNHNDYDDNNDINLLINYYVQNTIPSILYDLLFLN